MATEHHAKTDFEQILGNIDRRFDIIHTTWAEQKYFEAKFRTQIPRESEDFNFLCDEWVELFSRVTSTVWVKKISNTGPKIRFRKQYQCWTQGGKVVQKELLFDSRRCKGTLDIKVLTDNPLTRRKNKHIRLGLNVVVKINFTHLHSVETTKPFAFFVHECKPLPEPPKPTIAPNDKLPQLVAEMVQKGLNTTPKVVKTLNNTAAINSNVIPNQNSKSATIASSANQQLQNSMRSLQMQVRQSSQKIKETSTSQQKPQQPPPGNEPILQTPLQYVDDPSSSVHINQIIPIQNMESIKFQVQPQLTQVVVATPQLEVTEPLFMCQPTLMFEPSGEFISMPHFVQVHHPPSQQGHFL